MRPARPVVYYPASVQYLPGLDHHLPRGQPQRIPGKNQLERLGALADLLDGFSPFCLAAVAGLFFWFYQDRLYLNLCLGLFRRLLPEVFHGRFFCGRRFRCRRGTLGGGSPPYHVIGLVAVAMPSFSWLSSWLICFWAWGPACKSRGKPGFLSFFCFGWWCYKMHAGARV